MDKDNLKAIKINLYMKMYKIYIKCLRKKSIKFLLPEDEM